MRRDKSGLHCAAVLSRCGRCGAEQDDGGEGADAEQSRAVQTWRWGRGRDGRVRVREQERTGRGQGAAWPGGCVAWPGGHRPLSTTGCAKGHSPSRTTCSRAHRSTTARTRPPAPSPASPASPPSPASLSGAPAVGSPPVKCSHVITATPTLSRRRLGHPDRSALRVLPLAAPRRCVCVWGGRLYRAGLSRARPRSVRGGAARTRTGTGGSDAGTRAAPTCATRLVPRGSCAAGRPYLARCARHSRPRPPRRPPHPPLTPAPPAPQQQISGHRRAAAGPAAAEYPARDG